MGRVLCGEEAWLGGSSMEGAPWRVLHGEGAWWGRCSVGRELSGEGASWGGYPEEEEVRQLLTPLPLGAHQSKEGQKAACLSVRQARVWIPAQ